MIILRDLSLVILSLTLSYFIGNTSFGFQVYSLIFPQEALGSGFFGFGELGAQVISIVVVYVFLLPLLVTTFGSKFKTWWTTILVLPALGFSISVDFPHIWFYVLITLIGWGIGFGLHKAFGKYLKNS